MGYPFKHIYALIGKDEPQDLEDVSPPSTTSRWIGSHVLVSTPVFIFSAILQLFITVALIVYILYLRQEISLSPLNSQFRDVLGNYCSYITLIK